jgi:hypothetical protein
MLMILKIDVLLLVVMLIAWFQSHTELVRNEWMQSNEDMSFSYHTFVAFLLDLGLGELIF